MSQPEEWHPLLVSLDHLDWELSHVEVCSSTLAWNEYYVAGEIGYSAGIVRVRASWEAHLLPVGVKGREDCFLLELGLDIKFRNYEIDSRSSFGMEWPEPDEMETWLEAFFASVSLIEDLRPHLPLPIIESDNL